MENGNGKRINRVSNAIVHAKSLCSVNHKAPISKNVSAFSPILSGLTSHV